MFSQILGQEKAKRFLKQVMAREKIPHAYLFTGIVGVGKTSTAMALAMALNCQEPVDGDSCGHCPSCRKMMSGNFPDFISIRRPKDKKSILIEQIKELNRELRFAPVLGKYRVCVIHQAEIMTVEAANSFLKTLEEPPPGNILILNTVEPRDLLPTIVSRCQRVSFSPLPVQDMADWLVKERSLDKETAEVLANVSGGSPGRALKMSEGNFLEKRQEWLLSLLNLPGLSKEKAVDMAFEYAEKDKKRDTERSGSNETGVPAMLAVWESWYRDLLVVRAGGPAHLLINADFSQKLKKIAEKAIIKNLIDSVLAIDRAQQDLSRYRNKKLVMMHTVLRLKHLADAHGA
ncbi:MAG: DNA polymerase III subunit delta' [Desulfobulbaceae bacterium]|nr:DNA polymerase III subunit delta' [Desulfobulbaceae bacterium]